MELWVKNKKLKLEIKILLKYIKQDSQTSNKGLQLFGIEALIW